MVSERCQHSGKPAASARRGKDSVFVKGNLSVGDGGGQPVEAAPVDPLREESDNLKECTGVWAEFLEDGAS